MNTLQKNNFDSLEQLIFQNGLRIKNIDFQLKDQTMEIELNTPLAISISFKNFPTLAHANLESNGVGVHWPLLKFYFQFNT